MKRGGLESIKWCRNPQFFLALQKPTTMKIVCERPVAKRRKEAATVGALPRLALSCLFHRDWTDRVHCHENNVQHGRWQAARGEERNLRCCSEIAEGNVRGT